MGDALIRKGLADLRQLDPDTAAEFLVSCSRESLKWALVLQEPQMLEDWAERACAALESSGSGPVDDDELRSELLKLTKEFEEELTRAFLAICHQDKDKASKIVRSIHRIFLKTQSLEAAFWVRRMLIPVLQAETLVHSQAGEIDSLTRSYIFNSPQWGHDAS